MNQQSRADPWLLVRLQARANRKEPVKGGAGALRSFHDNAGLVRLCASPTSFLRLLIGFRRLRTAADSAPNKSYRSRSLQDFYRDTR